MSNKNVKELVKNVIEENAVAFKQNLNRTLYSKVGQKLQEKYIEVSKNIFEMANVEVAAAEASGSVGDTNAQTAPSSGSQGQSGNQGENSSPYQWPDYKRFLKEGPSAIPDPKYFFPEGFDPLKGPDPEKYPPLYSQSPEFKKDVEIWKKIYQIYRTAVQNHENWKKGQAKKEQTRQRTKGR